jgi:hypothetical protein
LSVSGDFRRRGDLLTGVDVEVVTVDTLAGILRINIPAAHWDSYTVDVVEERSRDIRPCLVVIRCSIGELGFNQSSSPTPQHVLVNADLKICLHPALRKIKYLHIGAISGIMIVNAIDG